MKRGARMRCSSSSRRSFVTSTRSAARRLRARCYSTRIGSARPNGSLADDVTMTSPRTEQRAASRCDAEAHVHDPPESRNRSKSCIASLAKAAAATSSGPERRRQSTAPHRLTYSSEEPGARFSTNRDFEKKERELADDHNMSSCIVCFGGGLLFCCSKCPLSMCGGCIKEPGLPMPSDDTQCR